MASRSLLQAFSLSAATLRTFFEIWAQRLGYRLVGLQDEYWAVDGPPGVMVAAISAVLEFPVDTFDVDVWTGAEGRATLAVVAYGTLVTRQDAPTSRVSVSLRSRNGCDGNASLCCSGGLPRQGGLAS